MLEDSRTGSQVPVAITELADATFSPVTDVGQLSEVAELSRVTEKARDRAELIAGVIASCYGSSTATSERMASRA